MVCFSTDRSIPRPVARPTLEVVTTPLARLLETLRLALHLVFAALLVVSSVASNALSRAAVLSGAEIDPRTSPNDLLDP